MREMNLIKCRDHVSNVADHESFSRLEMENSWRTHSRVRASKHQILHHIQNISKLECQKWWKMVIKFVTIRHLGALAIGKFGIQIRVPTARYK